jgi:LPXTG-motif cell wall-anchored protein
VKRPLAPIAVVYAVLVLLVLPGSPLAAAQAPPSKSGTPEPAAAPSAKADEPQSSPQPPSAPAATQAAAGRSSTQPRQEARAAGSGSVTIHDFAFGPSSLTVHVGDTVSWFNQGPAGHSATANDGSFNTGVLSKGSSGSFTFRTPGTFAYHCTPHPFMKASITVLAAAGGSSGSGSKAGASGSAAAQGGGSSGATSGSTAAKTGPSLPRTGLDVAAVALLGLLLLGAGALVRRRTAADS